MKLQNRNINFKSLKNAGQRKYFQISYILLLYIEKYSMLIFLVDSYCTFVIYRRSFFFYIHVIILSRFIQVSD